MSVFYCSRISSDHAERVIRRWFDVPAPGARGRRIDLFVGEPGDKGEALVKKARICVENKSVITAHRNKTNRLDDLDDVLRSIHHEKPEAIIVATVLVGTATKVLNVPDHVKKQYREKPTEFEEAVLPRVSTGDQSLWDEFQFAVSTNRPGDAAKTMEAFRKNLPTRSPGHTHVRGYDFILLVPVFVDNVNPPRIDRENPFGMDVDADYRRMLGAICSAYEARWHL